MKIIVVVFAAVLIHVSLPAGVSCDEIRAKVAEHGKVKAIIWAREHGYTWSQINDARRCLK